MNAALFTGKKWYWRRNEDASEVKNDGLCVVHCVMSVTSSTRREMQCVVNWNTSMLEHAQLTDYGPQSSCTEHHQLLNTTEQNRTNAFHCK